MALCHRLTRTRPAAVLLAATVALSACAEAAVATGAASAVSLTSTKKTLIDHAASAVTGQNCSTIVFSETGRYCNEEMVVDRSTLYCYRTLADVDCHHIPDPFRNGQTSLASPPPVLKPADERGRFD